MEPPHIKSITVKKELYLWNEKQEKLLETWGEECKKLSWLYNRAYKNFKNKNKFFIIVSVGLATVAGVGSFVNVECESWYSMGIGLIASISAGLTTINSKLDFGQIANRHKNSYHTFSKLYKEVSYILSFEHIHRGDSSEVMAKFKNNYDKAILESLDIPDRILEEYKKISSIDIAKKNEK